MLETTTLNGVKLEKMAGQRKEIRNRTATQTIAIEGTWVDRPPKRYIQLGSVVSPSLSFSLTL